MKRIVLGAGLLAIATTAVLAQADIIATRKATMKAVGAVAGDVGKMSKGEMPFDLAKVQAGLDIIIAASAKMPPLFPDNTKTGGETNALPAIWANKADFEARYAKLGADAKAAKASVKDEATMKAAFADIGKDCGGCHQTYRVKQN